MRRRGYRHPPGQTRPVTLISRVKHLCCINGILARQRNQQPTTFHQAWLDREFVQFRHQGPIDGQRPALSKIRIS